jgi:V-type H+-transporting ATPase subunit G
LDAEREAAKIVQKAKQCKFYFVYVLRWMESFYSCYLFSSFLDRVQRLKDARSEAAKEIEELKAQKNTEYQNSVAQVSYTSL